MKFLLADDHGLFREGIKLIFNKLQPDIEVVEAETLPETESLLNNGSKYDLILLDLKMPGVSGLDSVQKIVSLAEEQPVVVMSGAYRRADVLSCIDKGAAGFIPKTLGGQAMINAINLVLHGEKFIPSVICSTDEEMAEDETDSKIFEELTTREREVLKYLVEGHSNKVIASILELQEVTVRAHLKGVFRKLGVSSRTQAVGLALRSGFSG
ncbi:Glycerol metabolism activator AgmR [Candidatus Terasakiella magnetica]|uniref:Glycerol metabolism activator AgmR n=1 Tax=Candidatus Terasakiella magnetica TaxID=1867952 RepID=A0A1C3RC96_9PROT|nr:response regulator transcription factor [Candidatus Terasakiella magnetica]SCA54885.1 Glycerol metabolism activator AgmR [Candidatus Terasakiella magnetica]